MIKSFRGFGYLAALTLATAGFMFASCTLFVVVLWVFAWLPLTFWLLTPLLIFMAILEGVIFVMTMHLFRDGDVINNWSLFNAWRILLASTLMGFKIWELAYVIISGVVSALARSKRRSSRSGAAVAYRFSMKPIQERVNRQFLGICH